MTRYRVVFFVVLIFFNPHAIAQDISKYLDDGGFSNGKNILRIGYDPINGILPIAFERSMNRKLSLECSAGLVSLKRQNIRYTENTLPIGSDGLGFNFSGSVIIYLKTFPERSYISFQPGFSIMSGKVFTDIVFFNYGYQHAIIGKWMISLDAGVGVRFYEYTSMFGGINYTDKEMRFLLPVSVRTGYLF